MANRQVRLDTDVCGWVEDFARMNYCSLSSAANQLLRELRDGPPPAKKAMKAGQAKVRVARGANPRLATVLHANKNR